MPRKRLSFGTVALVMLESFLEKSGDYLREVAVLVVVFIPLDVWKHGEITATRIAEVSIGSVILFMLGMISLWLSKGVKYGRQIWEEEDRNDHPTSA